MNHRTDNDFRQLKQCVVSCYMVEIKSDKSANKQNKTAPKDLILLLQSLRIAYYDFFRFFETNKYTVRVKVNIIQIVRRQHSERKYIAFFETA